MQAAVADVNNATTLYDSQAVTNGLVGESHNQIDYQSILSPLDFITGVRADYDGAVILTGSQGTDGSTSTTPFLYQGPLNDTASGNAVPADAGFRRPDLHDRAVLRARHLDLHAVDRDRQRPRGRHLPVCRKPVGRASTTA